MLPHVGFPAGLLEFQGSSGKWELFLLRFSHPFMNATYLLFLFMGEILKDRCYASFTVGWTVCILVNSFKRCM